MITDEEKQAIETMRHWIEYEKQNKDKINKAEELIEIQETVLNLVESQAKELEKKDKMIELMGKLLYEHRSFFGWYEVGIDIESVEKQIEYFERKVEEDGNTNTEIG